MTANQTPNYSYLSYHRLSPSYYALLTSLSSVKVPTIVTEALVHQGLHQDMIEEMIAFHDNCTWELVP